MVSRSVSKRGQRVSLTATEFRLLHTHIERAGTVVPTAILLERVWGSSADAGGADVVSVTVHCLPATASSDAWTTLQPLPSGRHGTGAGVVDGVAYVPGGGPVNGGSLQLYDNLASRSAAQAPPRSRSGSG
jgi:hypothetical protein